MKIVNVNAKEILKELAEPEKMRISLYVSKPLYEAVQRLVGKKKVSEATERLWEKLIESAGKK